MIGDKDPEDAYDAGDPPAARLAVIERVLEDLRTAELGDRRELRRIEALRVLRNLAADIDELRARVDVLRDAFEDL